MSHLATHDKIWIDLDNSPHVPFFYPIIEQLKTAGYPVLITARDRFQVCELADHFKMKYRRIGRYYGKNKVVKMFWLALRALQFLPTIIQEKPKIALSHGSRSQIILGKFLGISSILISDYEYAKGIPLFHPNWAILPEIVSGDRMNHKGTQLLKYQGIKEDVYVPYFKPDEGIIRELGLKRDKIIVTIRPPATEAHYFRVESEILFESTMDWLWALEDIQLVVLPRSGSQKEFIGRRWVSGVSDGKLVIPKHAVEGLNLIWHSDLVISGGGTMNREAAALGVPVYSIFRGEIGAVDRYLSEKGRLVLIENKEQLYSKILLTRREKSFKGQRSDSPTLQDIVSHIVNIIEGRYV